MSKLTWDQIGERLYETGVDQCILFPWGTNSYGAGVPWNGVTAINESPSGAEANPKYADNIKYLNLQSAEEFGATIEAYMYPDEFAACDGSAEPVKGVRIGQQRRKTFGLCYRTRIGNDTEGTDYGYKLNFIYGALAAPSEKSNQTINESPEASTFSWTLTTTPVEVPGFKPSAFISVDSTKVDATKLAALEEIILGKDATTDGGTDGVDSRLPLPTEIISTLELTVEG